MIKAIDVWVNPFTPKLLEQLVNDPEVGAVIKWWHMEDRYKGWSAQEMVKQMDEANMEKVVIPSVQMYSYMRKTPILNYSTKDVADLVQQAPDRFVGLYGVNPFKKMQGVRELEIAVKEYGFKGAHIHCYGYGVNIDAADYYPYYAKCVELGVPVQMQIGHSAESMPSDCGRPIRLDNLALYFPELSIVAGHTGWPWAEELVALAWKHSNIYIGTSAHMPKYWDKKMVEFANTRGIGKVMWSTDFPVVLHGEGRKQIEELGLKENAKVQLLRETAKKVYKI